MKYNSQKLVDIALSQVGYQEKETNAHLDHNAMNAGDENFTKYARDLDKINFYNGKKNGFAWCDVFVDWCFVTAFGEKEALKITFQPVLSILNRGAGCKYSFGYYADRKRIFSEPQLGDQVFFYAADGVSICHTGLVWDVDDTYVYTVEGNTSNQTGVVDNGGQVCRKQYRLDDCRLAGYGRPKYD